MAGIHHDADKAVRRTLSEAELIGEGVMEAVLQVLAEDYIITPKDRHKKASLDCLNCKKPLSDVTANTKFCLKLFSTLR